MEPDLKNTSKNIPSTKKFNAGVGEIKSPILLWFYVSMIISLIIGTVMDIHLMEKVGVVGILISWIIIGFLGTKSEKSVC